MTKLTHTVNLALTAGVIVYDDRGACVQVFRLPYMTLFFWLPAALWGWLTPEIREAQPASREWPAWVREVGEAAAFFWQISFSGGIYWRLVW